MVNRTAKDGLTTVEEITVADRTYDLPPWIPEETFRAGVLSEDTSNALSKLVSCKLKRWESSPWGYSEPQVPIFDLAFEVPVGGIQELVVEYFRPAWTDVELEREITVAGDKIRVEFPAAEYTDFNDIQLISYPLELPDDFSDVHGYHEDLVMDMTANFLAFKRHVVGWDGHYEEFELNGVPHFLMLNVHED